VCFTVEDDGAGIPHEEQALLFKPFAQAVSGIRRNGTGLGLTICKALVEAHGGSIGFVSAPGAGGTTFTVEIPMDTTVASVPSHTPTASSMNRRLAVDVASAAMSPAAPRTPTGSDGGIEAPYILAQLPGSASPFSVPSGGTHGSPTLARARGGGAGAQHVPQRLPTPPHRVKVQPRSSSAAAPYTGLAGMTSMDAFASRSDVVSLADCGGFDERSAELSVAPVEAHAEHSAVVRRLTGPGAVPVAAESGGVAAASSAGGTSGASAVEGSIIPSALAADTAGYATVAVGAADAAPAGDGACAPLTVEVANVPAAGDQERAPLSSLRIPPTRPPIVAAGSPHAAVASPLATPFAAAAATSPGGAARASVASAMFAAAAATSPAKRWATPVGQLDASTALHFLVVDDGESRCCSS